MTTPLLTAGSNYVYHAPAERLLRWLPDNSIDLIVTSPPYDNLRTYKGFAWDFEYIARQSYRVLKPGGVLVWVVGDATIDGSETLTSFKQALYFKEYAGFNVWQTTIWSKPGTHPNAQMRYPKMHEYMFVLSKGDVKTFNPQLKPNKKAGKVEHHRKRQRNGEVKVYGTSTIAAYGLHTSVWEISAGNMLTTKDVEAFEHPAMFPEKLAERHILTWSSPGDVVLDFFMGSGTTAKMARNNGRRYIGCDIAAEYVALTNERLAKPYNLQLFAEATA